MKLRFEIVIEEDDGGYYAYCPALEGFHVGGETEEELLSNAKDGLTAYVKSLTKHDEPLPVGCIVREENIPSIMKAWKAIRPRRQTKRIEALELLIAA